MLLHNLTTSLFGSTRPAVAHPQLEAACVEPIERLEGRVLLAAADRDIVATGDFNGDNREDIVIYRRNAGKNGGAQLRVMLADNNGYRRGATIQVGRVGDVAVGDFDDDGNVDLVVAEKLNKNALAKRARSLGLKAIDDVGVNDGGGDAGGNNAGGGNNGGGNDAGGGGNDSGSGTDGGSLCGPGQGTGGLELLAVGDDGNNIDDERNDLDGDTDDEDPDDGDGGPNDGEIGDDQDDEGQDDNGQGDDDNDGVSGDDDINNDDDDNDQDNNGIDDDEIVDRDREGRGNRNRGRNGRVPEDRVGLDPENDVGDNRRNNNDDDDNGSDDGDDNGGGGRGNGNGNGDRGGRAARPGRATSITILLGNGDGSFDAPENVGTGGALFGVSRIRVGDFNDDGNRDLLVRARNTDANGDRVGGRGRHVWILLEGHGDGSFSRGDVVNPDTLD